MINEETKDKLLKELEKNGNVSFACMQTGIHRSIYYKWKKNDKAFAKRAREAEKYGRENMCDAAEGALMINVKKGKMDAIKYTLGHNSPRYKKNTIIDKNSNVVILHKKDAPMPDNQNMPFVELLERDENARLERCQLIQNSVTGPGKEIPNKPDGTPIELEDMISYEGYIRDWQEQREKEKQKDLEKKYIEWGIYTAEEVAQWDREREQKEKILKDKIATNEDSKLGLDKQPEGPQENRISSDKSV